MSTDYLKEAQSLPQARTTIHIDGMPPGDYYIESRVEEVYIGIYNYRNEGVTAKQTMYYLRKDNDPEEHVHLLRNLSYQSIQEAAWEIYTTKVDSVNLVAFLSAGGRVDINRENLL